MNIKQLNYKSIKIPKEKQSHIWKVKKKTLLNNSWAKEEITKELTKYLELNVSENSTYQNVWDAVKVVLRELCNSKCTCKKEERLNE